MKKIYTRFAAIVLMVVLFAAVAMGQKTIMFVISAADLESVTAQSELDINDSLLSWGFLVDAWSSADIQAGGLEAFYPGYDGIVVSEWVGSSSVNNLAVDDYQLPIVCFEGYVPRDGRWNWISDNDNQFVQSAGDPVTSPTIIIEDNSHYITEIFDAGDEVNWCDPVGAGITGSLAVTSWAEEKVVYSHKLAKNMAHASDYPDFWHMVAIDDDVLPNKVFLWGAIGTGLDDNSLDIHGGTDEFYAILHRACEWAFDEMPTVGVKEEAAGTSFGLAVFPNPVTDRAIFRFEAPVYGPAVATLYNVSGQQMDTFRKNAFTGRNFIELDLAGYAPGVYHVSLELDGRTEFLKLAVQ